MKAERLLLELLFEKLNKTPPTKETKKRKGDTSLKDIIKVLKQVPEFKEELDRALKELHPKKEEKKEKLSLIQRYMLWTIAAFTIPPIYIIVIGWAFSAMKGG